MSQKFYDIHCHAMNLSHPYLGAFIRRVKLNKFILIFSLPGSGWLFSKVFRKSIGRVFNLLSVMENDIGSMLVMLEECIKDDEGLFDRNKNELIIGDKRYTKLVLTPLIMDFGYHHIEPGDGFYSRRACAKPVADQVYDMFTGIRRYTDYHQANIDDYQLFEIYPFMGLNPRNYPLYSDPVSAPEMRTNNSIAKMLKKYFADYRGNDHSLAENTGKFNGNISDGLSSNYFAGIKVYPPLGFDPWPENNPDELAKVKYLYKFCCEKSIPITTHCSDGGFRVLKRKEALDYTNPSKWEPVLKRYPTLKLNLAHLGDRSKFLKMIPRTQWQETVIRLILKYENVYADFAYRGVDVQYYGSLLKLIHNFNEDEQDKLKSRILFGSDFMINLLSTDSYNDYLHNYSKCLLTDTLKDQFCRLNPESFLYKESLKKADSYHIFDLKIIEKWGSEKADNS